MGLSLNTAGGAQECLWPWRVEDQVQDLSRFTVPEWAGEMLGTFPTILQSWKAPPYWPLFFFPPPMPLGPIQPERPLEGWGLDPVAQEASWG